MQTISNISSNQKTTSKPAGSTSIFNLFTFEGSEELKMKQLGDAQAVADSVDLGELVLKDTDPGTIVPSVYYFHPDHLGSSTVITDGAGYAYQIFLNLPFGETMAEQRRSGSLNNPFKFNGKELDSETGLYYYGARYYDPRISLFISVDPLAEQTMTPYQYTYQNPINLTDPTGMAPEWTPNGDGTWKAEKGDGAWTLHKDAGISFSEAKQLIWEQISGTLHPGNNLRVDDQTIVFVNGKLGMGSPDGGEGYWSAGFVNAAKEFTGSNNVDYENVDYDYTSSAEGRKLRGYNNTIKYGGSPSVEGRNNKVVIVTHSMGGAYGEGVADAMKKQGWDVTSIYHFNAFQAADMTGSANRTTIDFQTTNDPVINNPVRSSPGSIINATPIRVKSSSGFQFRHRSPIDNGNTWNTIKKKVGR